MKRIGELVRETDDDQKWPDGVLVALTNDELQLLKLVNEHFTGTAAVFEALHKVKFGAKAFETLEAALRRPKMDPQQAAMAIQMAQVYGKKP